jgi:hypothetical protein
MNLRLFVSTLMQPWEGVHLTFQVFSWCLNLICQKERWIFMNVCWLSWTKLTHHQESVPFAPDLGVVEPTPSCQVVHQNYSMWNIQLGAHSRRWWMEDNVQNLLLPFRICCDAIWPY